MLFLNAAAADFSAATGMTLRLGGGSAIVGYGRIFSRGCKFTLRLHFFLQEPSRARHKVATSDLISRVFDKLAIRETGPQ